jgi:hypothetical protein
MNRRKLIYPVIAALFALSFGAISSFAHNGMEHVMGTVAAVTDSSITVETVKHTKVTVLVNSSTKFVNSNAAATLKNLKVGERVVIHAKDNAEDKLVGAEVKWGAGSTSMGNMEGMDHKH